MSVEAAVLLPVLLTLVALLAQPVCVLYTRSVMASAAGELVRLVATTRGSQEDVRANALRRLAAVPDVSIFHEGGPEAWVVETSGPDDQGGVSVSIEGRVRPLPLLGAIVWALGERDGEGVAVRVEAVGEVRSSWVGGSYGEWVGMWG